MKVNDQFRCIYCGCIVRIPAVTAIIHTVQGQRSWLPFSRVATDLCCHGNKCVHTISALLSHFLSVVVFLCRLAAESTQITAVHRFLPHVLRSSHGGLLINTLTFAPRHTVIFNCRFSFHLTNWNAWNVRCAVVHTVTQQPPWSMIFHSKGNFKPDSLNVTKGADENIRFLTELSRKILPFLCVSGFFSSQFTLSWCLVIWYYSRSKTLSKVTHEGADVFKLT